MLDKLKTVNEEKHKKITRLDKELQKLHITRSKKISLSDESLDLCQRQYVAVYL